MGEFSSDWLKLREPADHLARNAELTQRLREWAAHCQTVNIVDLGCGTGSNLRYLMPHIGSSQRWRLIDHDPQLLESLLTATAHWADTQHVGMHLRGDSFTLSKGECQASVTRHVLDLAREFDSLDLTDTDVVTMSALLDLTSAAWIELLVARCREHNCALLSVLNYDGRIQWQPALAGDERIRSGLNAHQQQDKGLGMALGPLAGSQVAVQLDQHGFQVHSHPSDWQIPQNNPALQDALANGWAAAVIEQDPDAGDEIANWLTERRQLWERGRSSLTVGHIDVLALPANGHPGSSTTP